ncbi:MAG: 2,3-bisphosphoglycerate-independent phosphoglycerate mutase [Desulfovibrionales bacterium]
MKVTPTLLLILDGWGLAPSGSGNALSRAKTPNLDALLSRYPHTALACSGREVGLPDGQMGNSEVGHMNIGAGRIVYQDIQRISMAIEDGSFFENPAFLDLIRKVKEGGKNLHLMGLVSPGGVHSLQAHLYALLALCRKENLADVFVHAILDGRDTPPRSGLEYVKELQEFMSREGIGRIATVSGRYYTMDRDKRWDRTALAYDNLVDADGIPAVDPVQAVEDAYAAGENDEFVKPRVICGPGCTFKGMQDGDGLVFFNFRADRARQITRALFDPEFEEFNRNRSVEFSGIVTMTRYEEDFPVAVAFPPVKLTRILGELVSERGMKQLRIAETEKYAHVTYFLNGGEERIFPGEERILIPSPREVATYDLKPEMSVRLVTEQLVVSIKEQRFDLIVCNLANLDMVGHTGIMEAAVKACEVVDECVGEICRAVLATGGRMFVTSDHGNAEEMEDSGGNIQTAHSTNPVPFVWVEEGRQKARLRDKGILGDIAPTILDLWKVEKPEEMTGTTLVEQES